jgi:exopolysaccharide biosynthesis polyprenyl glycosylphosphotransferase
MLPFAYYAWILWVIAPIWICALHWFGLYDSAAYRSIGNVVVAVLKAQFAAGLILLSVMYLAMRMDVSRLFLETFLVISLALLMALKLNVNFLIDLLGHRRASHQKWKVLLVGDHRLGEAYVDLVRSHPHWAIDVVRLVQTEGPLAGANGKANGVSHHHAVDWSQLLKTAVVDEVVVACPLETAPALKALAAQCAERGIVFRFLIRMPAPAAGEYRVEDLGRGRYFVSIEPVPVDPLALMVKRAIDVLGALVGLAACGVVFSAYAWRLKRESPGPVLFKQTRRGQNGRSFTLYKFRTMYPDAERRLSELAGSNQMQGLLFKIKHDPRVTPSGRFMRRTHLDELPQFWNVLRGDMSLVGTRPPTEREVDLYQGHHHRRLSFKPGITGVWQINGNGKVRDFEEVVKLDCDYIDNWSLWRDCKILTRTLLKVARADGW